MGNTLASNGLGAHSIEEALVVLHKIYQPDFLADFFDADVFSLGVMIDPPLARILLVWLFRTKPDCRARYQHNFLVSWVRIHVPPSWMAAAKWAH